MQSYATTPHTCAIRDCDRAPKKLGLCHAHYKRLNDGRPLDTPLQRQINGSISERIAAWSHRAPSGCLIWDGQTKNGYPRMTIDGRKQAVYAITYRLAYGDEALPAGWDIDHIVCHTRCCIEPEHLRALPKRSHTRYHHAQRPHGTDGRFLPQSLAHTSPVSTST